MLSKADEWKEGREESEGGLISGRMRGRVVVGKEEEDEWKK